MSLAITSPKLDAAFLALSNGKRRGMVNTLSFQPATVTQLANEFDLSLPAMHKHIKLLEKADLILRKKAGRTNFVALNKQPLKQAQDYLMQYRTEWSNGEETLENYIASLHQ